MIVKTFLNPATNKQWRIEIDGHTIRTCLNGGKVKEILCDSAFQVKSKAASAMMSQMRKGFVYQNRDAAVGQARCHRFVGKDSNGFMPLATALTRDDFFLTRVVGDFEDETLYHFDGSGEILETVSLGAKRMTYPKFSKALAKVLDTSDEIKPAATKEQIGNQESVLDFTLPSQVREFFLLTAGINVSTGVILTLSGMFDLTIHGERYCVLGEFWKEADGDQLLLRPGEDTIWYYAHEQDKVKRLCNDMTELLEKKLARYLNEQ